MAGVAIFTCSGNTITALGALASKDAWSRSSIKCGVIFYPVIAYCMGKSEDAMTVPFKRQLRADVPLFLVSIGQEQPVWKQAVADFLAGATAKGYPIQVSYFEQGTHGFDTDVDSDQSRALISQAVDFMKAKLGQ